MRADRATRVAIVGSGPSGFYAAEQLLGRDDVHVEVDMFDRLPTPYGLVRAGVAPDHPKLKSVTRVYDRTADHPDFNFFGNVHVGRDVTSEELSTWYDAVVYATGASSHRSPGVPGETLSGSVSATDFVGWYNGHPDYRDCQFDLSGDRAVIIGNGNVALDVARILTRTTDELGGTDIADHALEVLDKSGIREVVVLGRRGPQQSSFSNQELRELAEMTGIDVIVDPNCLDVPEHVSDSTDDAVRTRNLEMLRALADRRPEGRPRQLILRFLQSPIEIIGLERVTGIRVAENDLVRAESGDLKARASSREAVMPAGLVVWAIGYRGETVPGVPFDEAAGVIPNHEGQVLDGEDPVPGAYVVGWIKRGPSGLIGSNKGCAQQTVEVLVRNACSGLLPVAHTLAAGEVAERLRARFKQPVGFAEWRALDDHERRLGEPQGRPRVKVTRISEMLAITCDT